MTLRAKSLTTLLAFGFLAGLGPINANASQTWEQVREACARGEAPTAQLSTAKNPDDAKANVSTLFGNLEKHNEVTQSLKLARSALKARRGETAHELADHALKLIDEITINCEFMKNLATMRAMALYKRGQARSLADKFQASILDMTNAATLMEEYGNEKEIGITGMIYTDLYLLLQESHPDAAQLARDEVERHVASLAKSSRFSDQMMAKELAKRIK